MFKYICLSALLATGCGSDTPTPQPVPADDGGVVDPTTYPDPMELLDRAPGSSFVEIQEVRARADGLVFFCSGVQGLNIIDATEPSQLKALHRLEFREGSSSYPRCQHLALIDSWVYVSNKGDEISPTPFVTAFDLSGSTPREIGSFKQDGRTFEGLAAAGDYVYVAMHGDGLGVLQRNQDGLDLVGSVGGIANAWGVAVVGETVYVADGSGALVTVDVSNPAAPVVLGSVAIAGSAQSVEVDVDSQIAYVAAGQGGLVAIDVSNPAQPTQIAVADTPGTALQVALDGTRAYLADWNDVRVFDISTPTSLVQIASERVEVGGGFPRVLGIGAHNDVAFLGEWAGLYSYQLYPDRKAPDLWLSERTIDFGTLAAGAKDAAVVILRNDGLERLVVWGVESSSSEFSTDKQQLIIEPGEVTTLEVLHESADGLRTAGTLTLRSDDPNDQARPIGLEANGPGVGVGDAAPEIELNLVNGNTWRLSDQRGEVVLLSYFATF